MGKIIISSDSTCDLSQELCARYDIHILPLTIILGEETLKDGENVFPDDIYRFVQEKGVLPKTSASTLEEYRNWFLHFREQDPDCSIIHFNISSDMSGSYNGCRLASEEVPNTYAIDSRNLSTGIGQLAIEAAILRDQGLSAPEIVQELHRLRDKLDVSFVLDTLQYMVKGGRCSSVTALGANLLKLKPCLAVDQGVLGVTKKYRGKLISCIEEYVTDRLQGKEHLRYDRIFVTHSGIDEEIVQAACERVRELQPAFKEILVTRAGCSVSTHCGPGTLGVLFFDEDRQ